MYYRLWSSGTTGSNYSATLILAILNDLLSKDSEVNNMLTECRTHQLHELRIPVVKRHHTTDCSKLFLHVHSNISDNHMYHSNFFAL